MKKRFDEYLDDLRAPITVVKTRGYRKPKADTSERYRQKGAEMKPMGLIGGVLILVMFALSGAEGAEWEYITADKEGNQFYIDSESIARPSKDIVRVWVKRIYSDKGREWWVKEFGPKFSDVKESKTLEECNCATREVRIMGTTEYSSQGVVIISVTDKNAEWEPIPPETVGEDIFKLLCPKKGKK